MAPNLAEIARIVAVPDDVLRNLLITHCYHELALAIRAHTGPGANWCTFATWASKQAGSTIRGEDVRNAVRARVGASAAIAAQLATLSGLLRETRIFRDIGSLRETLMRALDAERAFERAQAAVAEGNRKVFQEIGYEFARYLESLEDVDDTANSQYGDAAADAESAEPDANGRFARFLSGLRPGEPPHGQALLREAFADYHRALATPDQAARAQLIFLANLCVGLHEQTRLQPEIARAMEAAFDADAVRRRILQELLPGNWLRVRHWAAALFGRRPPLDQALDRLIGEAQREMRHAITGALMLLHLPEGVVIRLGRNLEAQAAPSLQTLSNPRLLELLRRIDPTPDSVAGSGARDWADLAQRMHLITDLFRCYHEWDPLFQPPFTGDQVKSLRAGQRPAGPL